MGVRPRTRYTIGFNTSAGVSITGAAATGNVISQNQYDGTNGPTSPVQANDTTLNAGANNNQVVPTSAHASYNPVTSALLLQATENPAPTTTPQTLEIYEVTSTQRIFKFSTPVTFNSDPTMLTAISVTVPCLGSASVQSIIATVTDPTNGTSPFSASVTISGPNRGLQILERWVSRLAGAVIGYANSHPEDTIIQFKIPIANSTTGTAPFVFVINIAPTAATALPTIMVPTTIDGTTESTFLGKNAVIQINGGYNGVPGATAFGRFGPGNRPRSAARSRGWRSSTSAVPASTSSRPATPSSRT